MPEGLQRPMLATRYTIVSATHTIAFAAPTSQSHVAPAPTSARIPRLQFASRSAMHETQFARRYHVTGMVQGVGYRYFARQLAQRLGIAGYVKNLRDGRVEVYVIGPASVLASLRTELERGPSGSTVTGVTE